ncbi:hypothetical protein EJF36_17170 [Bacillus sp. HMF5848]|nr:hypothetical protein EJF36_17170 [Bacillus sp. HMF5848]
MKLHYTTEMEKAMYSSHGIGYEVYRRVFKERMKVEQRREQEYIASRRIVQDFDRKMHEG